MLPNTVKYTQQVSEKKEYNDLDNKPTVDNVVGEKKSLKLDVDKLLLMANVTVLF